MSDLLKINVNEVLSASFGGVWKEHHNYPTYYFSSEGKCARVNIGDTEFTFRLLGPTPTPNYYGVLRIKDASGKFKTVYIHRAVCEVFNGIGAQGLHVRHLDCNKNNNRASNLAWGTAKENAEDGLRNGKIKCGYESKSAKLNRSQAIAAFEMRKTGKTLASIAKSFGVGRTTITRHIESENQHV